MFVAVELHVRQLIIRLFALVLRDTLEIHSSVADHLRRRIFATPILVVLELNVKPDLIGQEQTDQYAHVQLVTEGIL